MDTKTITAYSATNIRIDGITKGPDSGWTWDGGTLRHPIGVGLQLAPEAARSVDEAVATAVPANVRRLTGPQINALPADDRDGWEWDRINHESGHGWYYKTVHAKPGTAAFANSDIVRVVR